VRKHRRYDGDRRDTDSSFMTLLEQNFQSLRTQIVFMCILYLHMKLTVVRVD